MIPKEIKGRYKKLTQEVNRHRHLYYTLDAPEISDSPYDERERELFERERASPELQVPDSPTMRVGGEPQKAFRKIRHTIPQWPFNDVFTEDEL